MIQLTHGMCQEYVIATPYLYMNHKNHKYYRYYRVYRDYRVYGAYKSQGAPFSIFKVFLIFFRMRDVFLVMELLYFCSDHHPKKLALMRESEGWRLMSKIAFERKENWK